MFFKFPKKPMPYRKIYFSGWENEGRVLLSFLLLKINKNYLLIDIFHKNSKLNLPLLLPQ